MNSTRNQRFLKAFGNHIREIRKTKGLSMVDLAFNAEIEYRQLGRIERGEISTTITTALKLAEALNVNLSDLFTFKIPAT